MRRATITHGVVFGGAPDPTHLPRELSRFGVTDLWLVDDGAALADALPLPVRVTRATAALPAIAAQLPERVLLCDAARFGAPDLGALLAAAAADPDGRATHMPRGPAGETTPDIAVIRGEDLAAGLAPRAILARSAGPRVTAGGHAAPGPRRPALFLDRDGTINIDHGYVGARDRFDWVAGARAAIRDATAQGWHVFLVTNQSGVARGYFDEAAVASLHDWMIDEIRRAGGTIDDVRVCPFHPDGTVARYRAASDWRKPAPGMILDLARAWRVDLAASLMIGDQPTDIAAAAAAGVAGHLFPGGRLDEFVAPLLRPRGSAGRPARPPAD